MFHLAQVNVARARAPLTHPVMADFVGSLDRINASAEAAPGFVWRFQDDSGSALETQVFEDPLIIVNLSVWQSIDVLKNFVYRSQHLEPLRRRADWFVPMTTPHLAMWWVPVGHQPSVEEARARLQHLLHHDESPLAFTFRRPFERPADPAPHVVDALKAALDLPAHRANLDGRHFVPQRRAPDGDAGPETRFAYRQRDAIVWATYEGGDVQHGLLAAQEDRGTLVMRYLHADRSGVPKLGTCVSAIEVLPGGRLRLHERWTWNGQQESHLSVLDEVTDRISKSI